MIKHRVDIIILSYAKDDFFKSLTEKAIESLVESEGDFELKIFVVESNKTLQNYQYPGTVTIYPKSDFGYNKYINIALEYTTAEIICVANNDLLFSKSWLKEIAHVFDTDSSIKSASPICPDNHIKYNILPNSGIYKGYRTAIELAGWCIVFKREILELNPFDGNLKFWYCDNDYANILKSNHVEHALVTSSIVEHLESITLKSESAAKQNKLTFREFLYFDYKWNHKNFIKFQYRKWRYDYPIFEKITNTLKSLVKNR